MKNWLADFPFLSQMVHGHQIAYLDNAATAQKPRMVLDALTDFYTTANANVHRAVYEHAEQATERYEAARAVLACFINAQPDEIVFTGGATQSINVVAHCWALHHLKPGDDILVTQLEHHANLLPWYEVARATGAQLRIVPIEPDGTITLAAYEQYLKPTTKLVSVVHTSHATGARLPVAEMIRKAHAVGALVLLDAAQSVAHEALDVVQLSVDFLAFSAHKMGGPTGIGLLFAAKRVHHMLRPFLWGGGMIEQIHQDGSLQAREYPYGFEAGTPPIAQAIGFAAAVAYIQTLDRAALQMHEAALCAQLIDELLRMPRVQLVGPLAALATSGHMVSFYIDGMHAHDVAFYQNRYGIAVRAGNLCAQLAIEALGGSPLVRVSFLWYNTHAEVERFVAVLRKLLG